MGGNQVLNNAFYGMQDTKTPRLGAVIAVASNIVLNLILVRYMRASGLALATSIAFMLNYIILLIFFRRKCGEFGGFTFMKNVAKCTVATVGILPIFLLCEVFRGRLPTTIFWGISVMLGLILYAVLLYVMKVDIFMFGVNKVKGFLKMNSDKKISDNLKPAVDISESEAKTETKDLVKNSEKNVQKYHLVRSKKQTQTLNLRPQWYHLVIVVLVIVNFAFLLFNPGILDKQNGQNDQNNQGEYWNTSESETENFVDISETSDITETSTPLETSAISETSETSNMFVEMETLPETGIETTEQSTLTTNPPETTRPQTTTRIPVTQAPTARITQAPTPRVTQVPTTRAPITTTTAPTTTVAPTTPAPTTTVEITTTAAPTTTLATETTTIEPTTTGVPTTLESVMTVEFTTVGVPLETPETTVPSETTIEPANSDVSTLTTEITESETSGNTGFTAPIY
jgi:hypothetical protein